MGTHPIFESDFDCLTDMEMDEDSFASIVGLKNDSIKEKIRKLRQKGDDLLQSIDNNLKPNIDRAELQQSEKKKTKILRLKNDLDADETVSDIKSGIILKRKLNLETDISKMKKVLVLAEELDKFEQRLQKVPTSVVGKARMFCEMTDWLEKHESGGKLGKLRVVQSYTNRIKILNPINTLVNMWSEYVKFQKDSIELKPPVKEVVDGLVVLDRLEHYLDELFSSLATLIERNRCLVFKKNVLSLKEIRDYKLGENVAAVCSFLVYVDELGFKLSGANLAKIESALVETFVRPTILAGAETSGEISNVLEAIQAMAREISVEFAEVERIANKLGELIENAKLAESLAQARTIAISAKPLNLDTVIPENEDENKCTNFDTLNLSDATKAQVRLMFQNPSSPISEKCSKMWHLMLKDRLGSHLIAKLSLFFIPSKNHEDIKNYLDCFCIFANDVEWIVGGLGRIAFAEQLTGREMLPFFKVIHKFHTTLEQYRQHHIELIQDQFGRMIKDELSLLATIEKQDDFEQLISTVSDVISHYARIKSKISKFFAPVCRAKFMTSFGKSTVDLICERVVALDDIAVDACTPLDMVLNKCSELEGYESTIAEDLRFMLRSSLSEITGMWKSGETGLTKEQVRSLIRALFSNTEHRSKALALIK